MMLETIRSALPVFLIVNVQEALEAPTFYSTHFPSSFYPRSAFPAQMVAEGRVTPETIRELERRGHKVVKVGDWANGKPMAIVLDGDRGVMQAGVSARGSVGYALAW